MRKSFFEPHLGAICAARSGKIRQAHEPCPDLRLINGIARQVERTVLHRTAYRRESELRVRVGVQACHPACSHTTLPSEMV
jgi:hypothetical protein